MTVTRRLVALFGTASVALAALAVAPATASAGTTTVTPVKSVGTQLPVTDFRAVEFDEDRGRLYLAQGVGAGYPLTVTDLDGNLLTRLADVTDVSDLVLSDDHSTLYVAQGFSQVTALDAQTLTVTGTYPAPAGACVYTVEPAGDKVVGGYEDCGIGSGGLAIWSAPGTQPVLYTGGPNYEPVIDASPGAPGLLVAGDTGYSPVTTYVLDVSGATPSIVARRDNTGDNLEDYALSPDGTEVIETAGYPYEHHAYRVPDLSDAFVYPSGVYPVDAAWSGDGSTVVIARTQPGATDPDVYFYDRDSNVPKYLLDLRIDDNVWKGTLLVNHDGSRAWAVSYDDPYQDTQLLHSFGPAHPPLEPFTDLTITATTGTGSAKHTAYVTAHLRSRPGGLSITIKASSNGGSPSLIASGVPDANGDLTATYALPKGTTTFTAHYEDYWNWYPSATATTSLTN